MYIRRLLVPGGTYFFTVVTERRRPILVDKNVSLLMQAFNAVKTTYPFRQNAIVVLPNHLHCLWTLPRHDDDFSTRWRLIKTWFSKRATIEDRFLLTQRRRSKQMRALWQHRYLDHVIRDERDYENHLDYIHINPVNHGYVDRAIDWPYSSFRAYVRRGYYAEDWGCRGDGGGDA